MPQQNQHLQLRGYKAAFSSVQATPVRGENQRTSRARAREKFCKSLSLSSFKLLRHHLADLHHYPSQLILTPARNLPRPLEVGSDLITTCPENVENRDKKEASRRVLGKEVSRYW